MSRFVSAGTDEDPPERSDEWLKAQQELDESRRQQQADGKQEGGKSLYDVLQANKAAKQEAFEESARLKNQFRSLDEDEVDFLDSVLESTRAKDAAVQKDTLEQLEMFRRQRMTADKATVDEDHITEEGSAWKVSGKKRRKGADKDTHRSIKVRKSSSSAGEKPNAQTEAASSSSAIAPAKKVPDKEDKKELHLRSQSSSEAELNASIQSNVESSTPRPEMKTLGLIDYSSDSE